MSLSRREILKAATAATLMLTMPRSVAVALERLAPGDHRFLVVALRSGDFLAIDSEGDQGVHLLRRTGLPDGRYALDGEGAIQITDEAILGVDYPASTGNYTLRRTRTAAVAVTSTATGARLLVLPASRRR